MTDHSLHQLFKFSLPPGCRHRLGTTTTTLKISHKNSKTLMNNSLFVIFKLRTHCTTLKFRSYATTQHSENEKEQ